MDHFHRFTKWASLGIGFVLMMAKWG